MTVAELIVLLQAQPDQGMRVVVNGYEGGYSDVEAQGFKTIPLMLNRNKEWYYGAHEEAYQHNADKADCEALVIGR